MVRFRCARDGVWLAGYSPELWLSQSETKRLHHYLPWAPEQSTSRAPSAASAKRRILSLLMVASLAFISAVVVLGASPGDDGSLVAVTTFIDRAQAAGGRKGARAAARTGNCLVVLAKRLPGPPPPLISQLSVGDERDVRRGNRIRSLQADHSPTASRRYCGSTGPARAGSTQLGSSYGGASCSRAF